MSKHNLKLKGTFSKYPHVYSWEDYRNFTPAECVMIIYDEDSKDAPYYIEVCMNQMEECFCGEGWTLEAAEEDLENDYEDYLEHEFGDKTPESKKWPSEDDDFVELNKGKVMDDFQYDLWKHHLNESFENFKDLYFSDNRSVWTITTSEPVYESVVKTPEVIETCKAKGIQLYPDTDRHSSENTALIQTGIIQDTRVYFRKNNKIFGIYRDYDKDKIVIDLFDCPINLMLSFLGLKRSNKREVVNKWLTEQQEHDGRKFTKKEFERVLAFLE